jgi:hypothetical protein
MDFAGLVPTAAVAQSRLSDVERKERGVDLRGLGVFAAARVEEAVDVALEGRLT